MHRHLASPEHLFDRPWQPGHPFRPRLSAARRWGMFVVFIILAIVIGGYLYLTDRDRVRQMAEAYLSNVLGGPVRVAKARLSLFEGLRLSRVEVRVDHNDTPDAVIFSADMFEVKYNPRAMLRGRLEATLIRAIKPHVRLTENLDTGRWNYQRMVRESGRQTTMPTTPVTSMVLPEMILRDAQIEYSEIRGGQRAVLGSLAIEGRLLPTPDGQPGKYRFHLQSHGQNQGVGPELSGTLATRTGHITASLENFEFGRDIRRMLPRQVRNWWERHELSGRVDIPKLSFHPTADGKPSFEVQTKLQRVTLAVHPEEWMSESENRARSTVRSTMHLMGALQRGTALLAAPRRPASPADVMASLLEEEPVRLADVSGSFTFTETGIQIQNVTGRLETNAFMVDGKIEDYSPQAEARLRVSSGRGEYIYIPRAPRYVASLPRSVREVYERLRPQGTASVLVDLHRPAPGARPEVSGHIEIVDGSFVFDRFPYPLRRATGKIIFGSQNDQGMERVEISNLRGLGMEGGPNENSSIVINGWIGPFGPRAGVNLRIEGQDVHSEPALTDAYPPHVRQALRALDAVGKGELPRYRGAFVCDIIRPVGFNQRWTVNVDVKVNDASCMLEVFPYPLEHVAGQLRIRHGYVDIVDATMKKGDGSLVVDGRISWNDSPAEAGAGSEKAEPRLRPELKITARGMPIDRDLLAALPAERRIWLEKIGIGGVVDIDGHVTGAAADDVQSGESQIGVELDVTLRNGTIWPLDGTFVVSDATGKMRLTPHSLELKELRGRRDASEIAASGAVTWSKDRARLAITATATDLQLDAPLYGLLPASAKVAWDAVCPEGSVDLKLSYDGDPTAHSPETIDPAAEPRFELIIHLRQLAATPRAVPYRLENLKGDIRVLPERVLLEQLTATHGRAEVKLRGVGMLGPVPSWDLKLQASNVPVDNELRRALPTSLAELMQALKLRGTLDLDFSKLLYVDSRSGSRVPESASTTLPISPDPGTRTPEPDIDFAVTVAANNTSLDVGVPLENVNGTLAMSGAVRRGRLADLAGQADLPTLVMAGRNLKNFRARLLKPADHPLLQISAMHAQLAGGEMAGQVDLAFPEDAPGRYAINLVLRNADVRELTGETAHDVRGELGASLAMEGTWGDPNSRRGRGDVSVNGRQLYRVPLVLGLLQITNLALPITSPFTSATARYSLEGQRVSFEAIDLRSANMVMRGSGQMDFEKKKVRLTFTTDHPSWPKVPVLGELVQGAKQELLQIHVNGTLEEPKASTRSMNTFSTTVDEVFRGEK